MVSLRAIPRFVCFLSVYDVFFVLALSKWLKQLMATICVWQGVVCQHFRSRIKIVPPNKDEKYKRFSF